MFKCDNPAVATALSSMKSLLESAGGFIDDRLEVVQEGDSLSLQTPTAEGDGSTPIISMPATTLVPVSGLELQLDGDDIIFNGHDGSLTPLQEEIAELMFVIYNETGKISHYRRTHPRVTLAQETAINDQLALLRPHLFKSESGQGEVSDDRRCINNFLGTRTLNFKQERGNPNSGTAVLMPFIDYANHLAGSPSFFRNKESADVDGISLLHSTPIQGSNECTVAYGQHYELMDTYIVYGFLDQYSPAHYVRAAPVSISLPQGTLKVLSRPGKSYQGKLPDAVKDLRPWLPDFQRTQDGGLRASHLLIPSDGSWKALRRVLGILLRRLAPKAEAEELNPLMEQAEQEILNATVEYYQSLKQTAENPLSKDTDANALEELITLCDMQLERLSAYSKHHSLPLPAS